MSGIRGSSGPTENYLAFRKMPIGSERGSVLIWTAWTCPRFGTGPAVAGSPSRKAVPPSRDRHLQIAALPEPALSLVIGREPHRADVLDETHEGFKTQRLDEIRIGARGIGI